jgi:HD-GYP domain-containing protein (c-di-GMP phosphodiesterase class II)
MNPEQTKPTEKSAVRPDQPVSRDLHRAAVDLLIRLHIVYKIAKIYRDNNDIVQEQAGILFEKLEALLGTEDEVVFRVRQGGLFFNKIRLKFALATYPIFKFVLEELRRLEIGVLSFQAGITREELVGFIAYLARTDKKTPPPFDDLLDAMREAGFTHVGIEKIPSIESLQNMERNTARIYFLSIYHLKEAFEKDKKSEKIKLNTTRRLMQSIFNHIVDNEAFVYGLTNIKNYDEYTLNHSVNVCMLSIALGRRLGLTRSELIELGMASFFHDLGKLETPIEILNKPAKLSDEEREIIEKHPFQGAEKLIHLKEFKRLPLRAIHVALEHHIKEDFSGYPHVLNKGTTNLFSKIVKIVDYFDAVTTKRVYRKNVFTRTEALALMLDQGASEFHPLILKAFVNMMGAYPVGTMVVMNTSEIGIVFDTNPENAYLLRPKVKIIADALGNRIDGEIADLAERDPQTGSFKRSIVKTLDPDKYDVNVPDYFLVQAL